MPGEMARLLLQLHLSASCPSRLVHAMISLILSQMSPPPVQTHRISSSRPRPALMLQSQPEGIFAQQPTQLCRAAMPGEMARLLLQLHLSASCPSRLVYAMISLILSQMSPSPVQTHRISSSRPRPALMLQSQPHGIFAQQPSQLCRTAMPGEMARLLVQLHLSASCLSRLVHAMISLIPFPMFFLPVQTHRISSSRPRPALMLQSQPHVISAAF